MLSSLSGRFSKLAPDSPEFQQLEQELTKYEEELDKQEQEKQRKRFGNVFAVLLTDRLQ